MIDPSDVVENYRLVQKEEDMSEILARGDSVKFKFRNKVWYLKRMTSEEKVIAELQGYELPQGMVIRILSGLHSLENITEEDLTPAPLFPYNLII